MVGIAMCVTIWEIGLFSAQLRLGEAKVSSWSLKCLLLNFP